MCSMALGEPEKSEDEIEKSMTTKAQLVAALRASSEYCRRAYAQSDADAAREATVYGDKLTRMFALALNATHDGSTTETSSPICASREWSRPRASRGLERSDHVAVTIRFSRPRARRAVARRCVGRTGCPHDA
jgi:hypothetical protein